MADGKWLTGSLRLDDALAAAGGFNEPHAQLVQDLCEHLALLGRQIAASLLIEQRQDLDHLRGAIEVELAAFAGDRVEQVAEMDRRGGGERQHEGSERQGW